MTSIIKNRLLLGTIVCLLLYVLAAIFLPPRLVSSASAVAVLVTGGLMAIRYSPDTYRILFYEKRMDGDDSHLAVYGAWLIAAGLVVSGTYSLLFFWYGLPSSWSGTAISGFGRAICASGLYLLWRSPNPAPPDDTFASNFLNITIGIIICIVCFLAGTHFTVSP